MAKKLTSANFEAFSYGKENKMRWTETMDQLWLNRSHNIVVIFRSCGMIISFFVCAPQIWGTFQDSLC